MDNGTNMNNTQSKQKTLIPMLIGGITLVLAGVGIFTALRLYQLRDQAVAPNAPESKLFAWDCSKYTFAITQTGEVSVENSSDRSEPQQDVDIFVDGTKVSTLSVGAFGPRSPKTVLGNVTVPSSGAFAWKAVGTLDCQNEGSYQAVSSSCKVEFDEKDKLYCAVNQGSVTVTGKVVSVPRNATLQTAWYIVNPVSKKTQQVYSSKPVQTGDTFSITGTWPGTQGVPAGQIAEIHFGLNVLDSNGNPFPNCTGSLDYYWRQELQNQCGSTPTPTPTTTPTTTPTGTPTTTPSGTPLPNLCEMKFVLGATSTPTATPTTTPTTTPSSTPTPTPTTTGTPTTGTSTPRASATPTLTATPATLPAAGSSMYTLFGISAGLLFIVFAAVLLL